MAFRPLGFAFELWTPLGLDESKRRVRECKQPWFDPINGPRGFILGRFICLWNSAFDRQGPMLIGWLHQDSAGCRIAGRSGSDINGVLYLSLFAALLPILAFGLFRKGEMGPMAAIVLSLCAIGLLLLLWDASRNRNAGLTLVHFLELAVGSKARHEFR